MIIMYCTNCGKEISKGSKFCENCGKQVDADLGTDVDVKTQVLSLIQKKPKLAIGCAIGAVALLAIIIVLICLKPRINPKDYIELELSGFDSKGSSQLIFDPNDELVYKLLKISQEDIDDLNFDEWGKMLQDTLIIENAIQTALETENKNELSNGDVIRVTVRVDREALKAYDGRFNKDVYEYTYVVGRDTPKLPEPVTINLLELVGIGFSGFDSNGRCTCNVVNKGVRLADPIGETAVVCVTNEHLRTDEWTPYIDVIRLNSENKSIGSTRVELILSKSDDLKNGEKITVEVSDVSTLNSNGIFISPTTQELTVSGLAESVSFDMLGALDLDFWGLNGSGEAIWTYGTKTVKLEEPVSGISEVQLNVSENFWTGAVDVKATFTPDGTEEPVELYFEVSYYPWNKLSNGDVVELEFETNWSGEIANRDTLADYGIIIEPECARKVSGLDDPAAVDLLGNLSCTYAVEYGRWSALFDTAPTVAELDHSVLGADSVTLTVDNGKSYRYSSRSYKMYISMPRVDETGANLTQSNYVYLDVNLPQEMKNGEEVVISLTNSAVATLRSMGITPLSTERTIIVEGFS